MGASSVGETGGWSILPAAMIVIRNATVLDPASGDLTENASVVIEGEPAYTALYEIEGPEVLTSAAWGRAVEEGRWPGQVRPHTLNRRHVLYRRV